MDREEVLSKSRDHNFWTWSTQANVEVIPVNKAKGVYFWDYNDKKFLDFNSMVMCVNIGHGNPKVIKAITQQAKDLVFAGPHMATKPRAELGEMLSEITPGDLNHFLYTLGGSDANENAVKLARAVTGKFKILSRYRSYHGATMGAMALTGDRRRLAWEPNLMPGVVHFQSPYLYRSTLFPGREDVSEEEYTAAYLANLEDTIICEGPSTIAAILLETVTGTNGIFIPPAGYLQGVRNLCDYYEILLIADEVMCGFGRTGKWFSVDHWGVVPDMITMAKGLTSGYAPLGAVAMSDKIASHFSDRVFYGGLTYNGHPLGLAAAIANIQVMHESKLIDQAHKTGLLLNDMLLKLKADHPSVGDVRSIGLFGAIELVKNRKTKEPLSGFNQPISAEMSQIKKLLFESGLFIYSNFNVLLVIPPLIISQKQLQDGIDIIDTALNTSDSVYLD